MRVEPDGTVTYFPLDTEGCEVAIGWYVELPENTGNVMGMVFRANSTSPWKFVIRTRKYVDALTDDTSRDERNGYVVEARPEADPDVMVQSFMDKGDQLYALYAAAGGRLYRLACRGPAYKFMQEWAKFPFNHIREEPRGTTEK